MALTGSKDPICAHIAPVVRAMIDNSITMHHDFEGTSLWCEECKTLLSLEAYGEEFTKNDIGVLVVGDGAISVHVGRMLRDKL